MLKKILIATDGSPSAREAVELGLELAEEEGAQPPTRTRWTPT
jgi:nucleotide-binding universal stress UspA family protein